LYLSPVVSRRGTGTHRGDSKSGNSDQGFVAAVEFGGKVRDITSGGESDHQASPRFNDEAERYSTGDLRAMYSWSDYLKSHVERSHHPGD
jgi:acyl-homoserine-lactone acylase